MKLFLNAEEFIETNEVLDISIPLQNNENNLRAWYVDPPVFEPVKGDGFVGEVKQGGSVNFRNIFFNPHGHGTHTECLGHITEEIYSINQSLKTFICKAKVISIKPKTIFNERYQTEDDVIDLSQLSSLSIEDDTKAIIIRTLPNNVNKKQLNYSDTNPVYLDSNCISFFNEHQIEHLLIDTPSVDREKDNGELAFHHAFWNVPKNPDFKRTITELIFVDDSIVDGTYLLDLQVAPFENDAAPSRPVLYKIRK